MVCQQSNDTTKMPQGAEQELATDAISEFYKECAYMAGVEVDKWLDSEPF